MIKRHWYIGFVGVKDGSEFIGSGTVTVTSIFPKYPDLHYFQEDISTGLGLTAMSIQFCHRQSIAKGRSVS